MAQTQESQGIVALLLSPTVAPFFLLAVIYGIIQIMDRTDVYVAKTLPLPPYALDAGGGGD